jgi:RNase P/RNase MRP subunit p29
MPYRWKKKVDVDEAIVVMMNVLEKNRDMPNWLIVTINGSIADSDKNLVAYFFEETKKHVPKALKYFESRE